MGRSGQNNSQYAFDFSNSYPCDSLTSDCRSDEPCSDYGILIRFVDAKTKAAREDALRRVRANGIFRAYSK